MKYRWLLLIFITVLAAFLRFYRIDQNPPGLYVDELSIGYNSYSVLKTGYDEHGTFLPINFKAFGEYKLPVYVYLTSISIFFFGLNAFAVRFFSAFLGTLTIPLTYFLVKKLFKDKSKVDIIAMISSLFLAISPWHLQFSRGGFEATVALFFIASGFLLWLQKSNYVRLIGTVSFMFAFYTYNSARIFVPLFFITLFFIIYRKKKISFRQSISHIMLVVLFVVPIVPSILTGEVFIRSKQASAFVESMSRFPTPIPIFSHLLTFVMNFSSYVSPLFLFFSGDGIGRHGVRELGQLHLFELPLLLMGLAYLIKEKNFSSQRLMLFLWIVFGILPASLHRPSPHALRSLFIVIPLHIISAIGLFYLVTFVNKIRVRIIAYASFVGIGATIIYFTFFYLQFYWFYYPSIVAIDWQQGHRELFAYLQTVEDKYEYITVTNWHGSSYIAGLFYLKYDPKTYLLEKGSSNGFGKYTFGEHLPEEAKGSPSLLVYPENLNPGGEKIKSINFINGDVAFDVWEF